jgi:hypothetical protein
VSDNGEIIVGYCSFDGSPFASTGFIWTPNTGVIDVNQWLANNGVLVDPNFTIQTLSAMTPDGTKIFGYGQMLTPPYTRRDSGSPIPSGGRGPGHTGSGHRAVRSDPEPVRVGDPHGFRLADRDECRPLGVRRVRAAPHHLGARRAPAGRKSVTWDGRKASETAFPRVSTSRDSSRHKGRSCVASSGWTDR